MIAPGCMPSYRARGPRKVMSYVRVRKRAKKARGPAPPPATADRELDLELVALAAGSGELPVARVRTRGLSAEALAGAFAAWLGEQVRWLRPRAIPGAIAFVGLFGIMAATSYLVRTPAPSAAAAPRVDVRWQHVALATPTHAVAAGHTIIDW